MELVLKSFTLIGPGRVGTGLAYLLQHRGYRIDMVIGHSSKSLEQIRLFLGKDVVYSTELNKGMRESDFVLLGVRDDQIENLVKNLWAQKLIRDEQILIHLSGVHSSKIGHREGMERIGRLALHPLQTISDIKSGIGSLSDAIWSLEGDEKAVNLGEEILISLAAKWIRISEEDKPLYHAAACIVSNYLVTITHIGLELLKGLGLAPEVAQKALYPLLNGTINNLREKNPETALTGPIARCDYQTIEKHLQALEVFNPQWREIYQVLGRVTLEFAPLSDEERDELARILTGRDKNGE